MIRILLTFLLFYSYISNAETFTISNTKVSKIYAGYFHKGIFFSIENLNSHNPAGCTVGINESIFGADPSLSDVGHVLSVLLTAQSAGKTIEIHVYNDKCFDNHRVIRRVAIH